MKDLLISLLISAALYGQQQFPSAPTVMDGQSVNGTFPQASVEGQGGILAAFWQGNNDTGNPLVGRQAFLAWSEDGHQFALVDGSPVAWAQTEGSGIDDWMQDTAGGLWKPIDAPQGVLVLIGDGWVNASVMHMSILTAPTNTPTSTVYAINPNGSTAFQVASPSIFIDANNVLHVLYQNQTCSPSPCNASSGGNTYGPFNLYEIHPVTNTLAGLKANVWSTAVQLNSTGTYIDPTIVAIGANYLLCAKENTGFTIQCGTSSTLTGPYTLSNVSGFTSTHYEKPSLVWTSGAGLRMYMDYECGSNPYVYSDSTNNGTSWSALTTVGQPKGVFTYGQGTVTGCAAGSYFMRAGQFIHVTDPVWITMIHSAMHHPHGSRPSSIVTNGISGVDQLQFTTPVTVASLPTCNATNKYLLLTVTDATDPTYNAALTGGGTVTVPVFCDGTSWKSH
jgi:hypothetical protein